MRSKECVDVVAETLALIETFHAILFRPAVAHMVTRPTAARARCIQPGCDIKHILHLLRELAAQKCTHRASIVICNS